LDNSADRREEGGFFSKIALRADRLKVVAAQPSPDAARWALSVLVLAMAVPAQGRELRVRLEQVSALPFREEELVAALALRLPEIPGPFTVTVVPAGLNRVAVEAGGRRLEIETGDQTGREAARLVAVLVVDVVAKGPGAGQGAGARRPGRLSAFVAPGVGFAISDAGATFAPVAGAGWRLGGRTRALLSIGYARSRVEDGAGTEVISLDAFPVRAGLGVRVGPIEVQGGGLVQGFRVSGRASRTGMRPGGWLAASWTMPGGGWARPFLAAGTDLLAEGLELRAAGRPLLSAGHLAPWAAAGLAFGAGAP
jgi:hypothetical protein